VELFFESLSHAVEFHVVEFFQGWFHKHRCVLPPVRKSLVLAGLKMDRCIE
jgi:hypothetical protein